MNGMICGKKREVIELKLGFDILHNFCLKLFSFWEQFRQIS